jgi:hypothetical protein
MLVDLDQDQPRTYVARGNPKLELIATLGGGFVFLIAVIFMIIALFAAPATGTSGRQPGFIGGLSVIPIMLISRGLFTMRNITRVTLDKNGIGLESPISFKMIPWNQIERIEKKDRSSFMSESHETLILMGANNKELGQIRDTLDRFPDLIQQIEIRSAAAHGTSLIADDQDTPADTSKARRRAKLVGSLCALLTLGMMAGTVASFIELSHERKFARESVPGQAKILKHYMNRQTPYVEVEFTDPAGQTHNRVTMMEMAPWEELAHSETVRIEYVRSDPSLYRLVKGEDSPSFSYFWIAGLIATLVFGAGTVFTFLGYDLKTKGGVFQVTRWGQPLDD